MDNTKKRPLRLAAGLLAIGLLGVACTQGERAERAGPTPGERPAEEPAETGIDT